MTHKISSDNDQELTDAIRLLHDLLPEDEIGVFSLRHSPATVYTTLITLWMITLQRLGGGRSLKQVVRDVLMHGRDILPDNKRVREGTLSKNSSAFNKARKRLSIEDTERFLDLLAESIMEAGGEPLDTRRMYMIDGTTFKLPPTSDLREVYPPATNQLGESVWPLLMITVAHELHSGAALRPEFGAMYGPKNTSETKQAIAMMQRIPVGSFILADSGYGIFRIVYEMHHRGLNGLCRLTKSRFTSMRRKAELMDQTPECKRYRLHWRPTSKDRKTLPELPKDAELFVELHEIELEGDETLYLVTNVSMTSEEAADLYSRRYDVEHDIRDIKVTLGVENIRARSDEMVRKEMLCGMAAYNLVVQLRKEAAQVAKLRPRRLSFTDVWTTMQCCLLHQPRADLATWRERYEQAVAMASTDVLPLRPGRKFPRKAHARRPKSTKFMKQQAAEKAAKKKQPPPEQRK